MLFVICSDIHIGINLLYVCLLRHISSNRVTRSKRAIEYREPHSHTSDIIQFAWKGAAIFLLVSDLRRRHALIALLHLHVDFNLLLFDLAALRHLFDYHR